jgi:phytoene dehydrogenase-like protein
MADELRALGGRIETERRIGRLHELPADVVTLFDVAPRSLSAICGDALPASYRRRLDNYRHGAGVFKLDIALDGPVPWRDAALLGAGTVHLGPTLEDIARSEHEVSAGRHSDRPFVLLAQQSLFDPTRAPAGKHTVWAYCHVPNGSMVDMSEPILRQIERFAPGFRERILALVATGPAELERANANYVGGDIACGRFDFGQLFTRPSWRVFDPYATPNRHIYLCSAASPPGPGVHGMAGLNASRSVLRRLD